MPVIARHLVRVHAAGTPAAGTGRADRRLAALRWLHPAERVRVQLRLAADDHISARGRHPPRPDRPRGPAAVPAAPGTARPGPGSQARADGRPARPARRAPRPRRADPRRVRRPGHRRRRCSARSRCSPAPGTWPGSTTPPPRPPRTAIAALITSGPPGPAPPVPPARRSRRHVQEPPGPRLLLPAAPQPRPASRCPARQALASRRAAPADSGQAACQPATLPRRPAHRSRAGILAEARQHGERLSQKTLGGKLRRDGHRVANRALRGCWPQPPARSKQLTAAPGRHRASRPAHLVNGSDTASPPGCPDTSRARSRGPRRPAMTPRPAAPDLPSEQRLGSCRAARPPARGRPGAAHPRRLGRAPAPGRAAAR